MPGISDLVDSMHPKFKSTEFLYPLAEKKDN
jgi:hypothetical protein